MTTKDTCLAYLENQLSAAEREAFEQQLANNPELQRMVEQYEELLRVESALSSVRAEIGPDFTVVVMDALENEGVASRFFRRYLEVSRRFVMPVAGFAVVVLCVLVARESADEASKISVESASESESIDEETVRVQAESEQLPPVEVLRPGKDATVALNEASPPPVEKGAEHDSDALKSNESSLKDSPMRAEPLVERKSTAQSAGTAASQKQDHGNISADRDFMTRESSRAEALDGSSQLQAADLLAPSRDRRSDRQKREAANRAGASPAIGRAAEVAKYQEPYVSIEPEGASRERRYSDYEYYRLPAPPAQPAQGEKYGQYEETPRLLVAQQPVSTFSIDVDTGSYTNARRFLRMGQLPPKDSIRLEEFINYFNYNYPQQGSEPFAVHYEVAPSPFSSGRHIVKLGVKAKEVSANRETPWNLVFLVDVSGSMNEPNKLPLVKQSLNLLASQMRAQDRIALVTYASGVQVVLESTTGAERERIIAAINQLQAGGGTYGSGGIQTAYEIAARNRIDGGVNRVILATDGDFNVGISDFSGLMSFIEDKRKQGTTLTTLGFGSGNYHEKNLEQLANRGNGNYFYIDTFDEARRALSENLTATMQVVAKDVKIQVEFNPAQVVEYRLLGYDNRRLRNEDFHNDAIDAGEIGAGHTVTALYEVTLAQSPLAAGLNSERRYGNEAPAKTVAPATHIDELGYVKLRFKEPEAASSVLREFPLSKNRVVESLAAASSDFRFATAVAGFAQLLRGSAYNDEYSFARLREALQEAEILKGDPQRIELKSLVENAASISAVRR